MFNPGLAAVFARDGLLGPGRFCTAVAITALLAMPQVSAALIVPLNIGNLQVVVQFHDDGTGMAPVRVWLGARHTRAMSFQDVENEVAGGNLQAWTIAHEVDVRVLFADAGLSPFAHLGHFGSRQAPLTSFTNAFTALCEAFVMGNCAPAVPGNTTTRRGRTANVSADGVNQVVILFEQTNSGAGTVDEASIRIPGNIFSFSIDNNLADDTVFAWLYIDL